MERLALTRNSMKKILIVALGLISNNIFCQTYDEMKIVFQRRTNLEKRYDDPRMKRMINNSNKIRNDEFTLFVNTNGSAFVPIESESQDRMSWLTSKNSYFQNVKEKNQLIVFSLFGNNLYIKDSLPSRSWKITENTRTIAGYECRKAIYQKNDSTRIYAWYSPALIPSVGPEGFCGLPGTILGVATEDGGIIYFAKSISFVTPKSSEMSYNLGKNKTQTIKELEEEIKKKFGNQPWGKNMFEDLFRWL